MLSNADPKRTLLGLVGAELLDRATRRAAIEAYRCDGASLKINLAVGELPRIAGTPAGVQPHHRGLVQITLPAGGHGRRPGGRPRRDPGRRPRTSSSASRARSTTRSRRAGKHVITLGFRSQPYRLAESDWDAERERVADRLIDGARDMIPNLPRAR